MNPGEWRHRSRSVRAPRVSRLASRRVVKSSSRRRPRRRRFSRASVARSRRVRARAVSRDANFSDRCVSPRNTPRAPLTARREPKTRARRREPSPGCATRLTFSRASVARSRRVRARAVSRRANFSDRRVSPRERVARASRVARRRAMPRARRVDAPTPSSFVTTSQRV